MLKKRELVALLLLCSECHVAVIVLGLLLAVPLVVWGISWSYSFTFCSLLFITHLSLNEMGLLSTQSNSPSFL